MTMKKLLFLCIVLFCGWTTVSGQGIVRGKITDENGETIIGATVVQKDNHSGSKEKSSAFTVTSPATETGTSIKPFEEVAFERSEGHLFFKCE